MNDDYEVGYKKPPKATRYKKGKSGNPKGRPKSFDALRKLVQDIGAEPATDKSGNPIIDPITGMPYSRIELLIRAMLSNTKQSKVLLAYGWGEPTRHVDVTSNDKPIGIQVVDYRDGLDNVAPAEDGSVPDSD